MQDDGIFSRERLAGYDRDKLEHGIVTIGGCGALANNVAMNLALAGVAEMRFIDFDKIEPSNLTRSPLFRRECLASDKRRPKARALALGALELSYADSPVVRYAPHRLEALGLGALEGSSVVASAVDNFGARAWLADATRLLGVPFVEAGFSGSRMSLSVFPNRDPDSPCYRCLNPSAEPVGVSCELYARGVVAEGRVPATQTIAALAGSLVAEAVIQTLHGEFPLGGRFLTIESRTGRASSITLTTDPDCHGVHRRIDEILPIAVCADEPLARVFEALPELGEPELILPSNYLVSAPCGRCGRRLVIGRPAWAVLEAPACESCEESAALGADASAPGMVFLERIGPKDRIAQRPCRRLGLPPLGIFELFDRASGISKWAQLSGSLDDLYVVKRRSPRNAEAAPSMNNPEADLFSPVSEMEIA